MSIYDYIKEIEEIGAFVSNIDNSNGIKERSFDIQCNKDQFSAVTKKINEMLKSNNERFEIVFSII